MTEKPIEGIGLGLRFPHFDTILKEQPAIPWFEVITDNFLDDGPHHQKLEKLRQDYPIALHSIGFNLGGVDDFNQDYLKRFKQIYDRFQPQWISDHLCWSAHGGRYHHDLLPIPRTKEGLENVCCRINYLQDYFQRSLVVENITAYVDFKETDYSEIEFIKAIIEKTGCYLLLDISNVHINQKNRVEEKAQWWSGYPLDRVKQIHLAGGKFNGELIVDTHSQTVPKDDIEVLKQITQAGYNIPAMIERDADIPSFVELETERQRIEASINELS